MPQFIFYLSGGSACVLSVWSLTFSEENSPLLLIIVCLMWLVFAAVVMYERKMLNTSHIILIIAIAGFILRLGYIAYTAYNQRQHDVYVLAEEADTRNTFFTFLECQSSGF